MKAKSYSYTASIIFFVTAYFAGRCIDSLSGDICEGFNGHLDSFGIGVFTLFAIFLFSGALASTWNDKYKITENVDYYLLLMTVSLAILFYTFVIGYYLI